MIRDAQKQFTMFPNRLHVIVFPEGIR